MCAALNIDIPELTRSICDRHSGIGADGIVLLGAAPDADASFRIYNSDGSEATLSGNALRCAAAVLSSEKAYPPEHLQFSTPVGLLSLDLVSHEGARWVFRAQMGRPEFSAAKIPFTPPEPPPEPIRDFPMPVGDTKFRATVLFMGNPQCILFLDDWDDFDWHWVGQALERHAYFPDRANIGFVRVLREDKIEARFWERGAGHTLASGTGSCACAVAAHLNGETGRAVEVALERGSMHVNWREDGVVELTGPAEVVAQGQYSYAAGGRA